MCFAPKCIKSRRLFSLIIGIMVTVVLSGCSNFGKLSEGGAEIAQVPITDNPSGETFPGRFIWHDLLTSDLISAGKFYEKLFDWKIEYHENYALARNGGKLIAGIIKVVPSKGKIEGVWMPSVSVVDVDSAAKLVAANGGTVLNGPLDMKRRGRAALVRDFQGADIVLLKAKGGDPSTLEPAIGDWLWDEIWTQNPEKTEEFYASLIGYEEVLPIKNDYGIFMREGEWMAGVRHVTTDAKDLLWVPVVRVEDPEAICRHVEELGGVVWITPDEAPNTGNTSLISDPTGALLLIQRWSSQSLEGSN